MYLRLAFAVAAHVEPDILLVDEVLAVGDIEFQKKCFGKMQGIAQGGHTVLFISHNMAPIRQLCNRAILLREGRVVTNDSPDRTIADYLAAKAMPHASRQVSPYGLELLGVSLRDERDGGGALEALLFDRNYVLEMTLRASAPVPHGVIVARIYNELGILVSSICSIEEGIEPFTLEGEAKVTFALPRLQLFPGRYTGSVFVYRSNDINAYLEAVEAFSFSVHGASVNGALLAYRQEHGIVRVGGGGRVERL
jgi:lipopolysaccharide transport system ATP-binding protein